MIKRIRLKMSKTRFESAGIRLGKTKLAHKHGVAFLIFNFQILL